MWSSFQQITHNWMEIKGETRNQRCQNTVFSLFFCHSLFLYVQDPPELHQVCHNTHTHTHTLSWSCVIIQMGYNREVVIPMQSSPLLPWFHLQVLPSAARENKESTQSFFVEKSRLWWHHFSCQTGPMCLLGDSLGNSHTRNHMQTYHWLKSGV